ncbi:BON domain-containing protein [Candidatus Endoriftia persephonae]|jgi:osmotically-inducible protein OsmY|uniref:BON domain-containing protein n=3 Tax=Gammaproteobacteria TaxID=1236 RepID=A0A9J7A068_9GAMM|nr:BON domain-containing protein [Candidatus Endoriftia persephone]EGV49893.1 putative phospholipid-binding domain protein [endosymbiont of Riftia pachyptila (vent Ph05)]KRT54586.1 Osmotically-inducible protein OsmY [endosymbiont of Ridgeia piscesae]KRT57817.1 Osmotically-inducible protein OsmY, contains BON domain [endosymbiont of Ridgeia piscesae]USF88437.1 BON domain-containing protein [Candidatus Endoriftia persephone]
MSHFVVPLVSLLFTVTLLQGCAAAVVGGAATGVSIAHDRRTMGTFIEDQNIELKASSLLRNDATLSEHNHISVTSFNMVVLLTGQAASASDRLRTEQIVKKVEKVRRVVNELEVGSGASFGEITRDSALSAEVKFKLTKVKLPGFDPLRIKVITERGVVYLMGLVSRAEADAATGQVRKISGVRRVVRVFEYI